MATSKADEKAIKRFLVTALLPALLGGGNLKQAVKSILRSPEFTALLLEILLDDDDEA